MMPPRLIGMLLFGAEPLMAVLQLNQHMSCLKKAIGRRRTINGSLFGAGGALR